MPRASAGLARRVCLAVILALAGMAGPARAQDAPTLTIGYVDLIDDQRYLDWGIHPIDIRTGEAQGPPANGDLATYPVRVEGEDVLVGVPKG